MKNFFNEVWGALMRGVDVCCNLFSSAVDVVASAFDTTKPKTDLRKYGPWIGAILLIVFPGAIAGALGWIAEVAVGVALSLLLIYCVLCIITDTIAMVKNNEANADKPAVSDAVVE
jgi:hypothetical protein